MKLHLIKIHLPLSAFHALLFPSLLTIQENRDEPTSAATWSPKLLPEAEKLSRINVTLSPDGLFIYLQSRGMSPH